MPDLSVFPNPAVTFTIAHEDEHLVVVEKRAHLVTQPGKGHDNDTLLNGLFARFGPLLQQLGKSRDFGLLHRLDRDTSGLLVVALRAPAYDALRTAFETRAVRKFYWAVTSKPPRPAEGVISKPIAESIPRSGEKKLARISSSGKPAVTAYRTLSSAPAAALVECRPVTGRLHQVRVHLEAIGCPILGDRQYAPPPVAAAATRLALHSHRLAFEHPATGAMVDVRSAFPRDLRTVLKHFGLSRPDAAAAPAGEPNAEAE